METLRLSEMDSPCKLLSTESLNTLTYREFGRESYDLRDFFFPWFLALFLCDLRELLGIASNSDSLWLAFFKENSILVLSEFLVLDS